jgi:hypothetical protein
MFHFLELDSFWKYEINSIKFSSTFPSTIYKTKIITVRKVALLNKVLINFS